MFEASGRIGGMTTPDHPSPAQGPTQPVPPDRVYRSPSSLVAGVLLLGLALWLGGDALFVGHGRTPWLALATLLFAVPLVIAFTLRPAVLANDHRLRVRNPFRVVVLPWGSVAGFRSGFSNEVVVESGTKYQLWAIPVSLRARKRANRAKAREAASRWRRRTDAPDPARSDPRPERPDHGRPGPAVGGPGEGGHLTGRGDREMGVRDHGARRRGCGAAGDSARGRLTRVAFPDESLRLPSASIPDGCQDWTTARAAGWSAALPPRWTFLRVRRSIAAGLATLVLCVGALVAMAGGLWPFVAAGFAVYVLWVLARPELVWVGAPLLLLALAAEASSKSWALTGFGVVVVLGSWAVVAVRLRARGEQLERAVEAAGGVAVLVPGAEAPVRRGRLLFALGFVVLALGVLAGSTAGLWGSAEDQEGAWVVTVFLAGLGATALASAWLGRQRAGALRGAPVPVLRVLVRDDAQGGTEVYAADDLAAERPLFTVDLTSFDEDDDDDEGVETARGRTGTTATGTVTTSFGGCFSGSTTTPSGRSGRPFSTALPSTAPRCSSSAPTRIPSSRR